MTPSPHAINSIKNWEKLRLQSYQDVRGIWTLGYGETGPHIGPGLTVTPAEAEGWLSNRTTSLSDMISGLVKVPLKQNQFDALVSLVYNIGITAFSHSTMLKLINQNQLDKAALEFIKWDHVNGTEVEGLRARRLAERSLFVNGP